MSLVSYIVTELTTKIINLPVLQYSPITGLNGAMATLAFGALNNTFRFHPKTDDGLPVIADIWGETPLSERHALTIMDALTGAYNTGPGYDPQWFWKSNRLLFSEDPVALDTVAQQLVNDQRKSPLRPLNRETQYLRRAASNGVGVNNADDIDHQRVEIS